MIHVSKIILTIGIPGCGKTTWVRNYKKQHPSVFIVSTDEIRKEWQNGIEQCINPSLNDAIHDEARKRVKAIIDDENNYGGNNGMGPEVIVDSTNTDVEEWIKYKKLNPTFLVAEVFETTPDAAFSRQQNRTRKVPLDIITWKWKQLQENKKYLSMIFNFIFPIF